MRVPQAVKDAARYLTNAYIATFVYLGSYKDYEAYTLGFLEPVFIGLPEVYLYKEGEIVVTVYDSRAFDIIKEATKNVKDRE